MGLLREQAEGQAALAMDLAEVGLVATRRQAEQRRLAGAVRADQADPVAEGDRGVDRVEDDEGADLAGDARQAEDAHRAGPAAAAGADARAAARRVAAARFVRSVRPAPRPGRLRAGQPQVPSPPARSSGDRPGAARRSSSAGSPRRPSGRRGEPLAPRAEVGRPRPDDDPLDRPAAARTRLAGALVDLQVLLHRAVAIGRRVVVDGAAAPLDGLGSGSSGATRTGAARRRGGACRRSAAGAACAAQSASSA